MERKLWEESHHLVFVCEVLGLEIKSDLKKQNYIKKDKKQQGNENAEI